MRVGLCISANLYSASHRAAPITGPPSAIYPVKISLCLSSGGKPEDAQLEAMSQLWEEVVRIVLYSNI